MGTKGEALVAIFEQHAAPAARGYLALPDFAARLEAVYRDAQGARPTIQVPIEAFVAHLAARLGVPALPDSTAALDAQFAQAVLHAADLYLAAGVSGGSAAAVRVFEDEVLSAVPRYVGHVGHEPAFVAEAVQLVRERMLLGQGDGSPRILAYDGRGALGGLVRVAAIRAALDLRRRGGFAPGREMEALDDAIELASASADPETEYMKRHHTQAFREVFTAALAELDRSDRTLLRMHHLDGLSIDELGTMLNLHRSTVARRVARARQRVLERTHALLLTRLGLAPDELTSFMDGVRSRFHLSLQQFLTQEEESR